MNLPCLSACVGRAAALGPRCYRRRGAPACHMFDDVFGQELVQLGTWGDGHELLAQAGSDARASWPMPDPPRQAATWWPTLRTSPLVAAQSMPCCCPIPSSTRPIPMPCCAKPIGCSRPKVSSWSWDSGRPASGVCAAATRGRVPAGAAAHAVSVRIRDWLGLLSYEIVSVQPYLYHMPGTPRAAVEASDAEHAAPRLVLSLACGGVCLKARKRVYTLPPYDPGCASGARSSGGWWNRAFEWSRRRWRSTPTAPAAVIPDQAAGERY